MDVLVAVGKKHLADFDPLVMGACEHALFTRVESIFIAAGCTLP